jgi:hypothetical protein
VDLETLQLVKVEVMVAMVETLVKQDKQVRMEDKVLVMVQERQDQQGVLVEKL